jgi:hypothetical protein
MSVSKELALAAAREPCARNQFSTSGHLSTFMHSRAQGAPLKVSKFGIPMGYHEAPPVETWRKFERGWNTKYTGQHETPPKLQAPGSDMKIPYGNRQLINGQNVQYNVHGIVRDSYSRGSSRGYSHGGLRPPSGLNNGRDNRAAAYDQNTGFMVQARPESRGQSRDSRRIHTGEMRPNSNPAYMPPGGCTPLTSTPLSGKRTYR